jgi:hypothetical protein
MLFSAVGSDWVLQSLPHTVSRGLERTYSLFFLRRRRNSE